MPKKADSKKKIEKEEPKEEKKTKKETKLSQLEFEKKVLELAEKGITSEKIGETLRKEGIHSKEFSKKISKILKDAKKYVNPDLKNTEEKLNRITEHYNNNNQDKRAKREKDRVFAQVRKLKKYFKVQ